MDNVYKRLEKRDWDELSNQWLAYLPEREFPDSYPNPTLGDLSEIQGILQRAPLGEVIGYEPGIREAVFREFVILLRKSLYFSVASRRSIEHRKQTLAALLSYDACFFAAKSLLYLLGFASVSRGSPRYLDAFHKVSDGNRKRPIVTFYMTVHDLKDRLTHEVLWGLTKRNIFTVSVNGDAQTVIKYLRHYDWARFSRHRNRISYDGSYWPLYSTIDQCDILDGKYDPLIESLDTHSPNSSVDELNEYLGASSKLQALLKMLLSDIAKYAPSWTEEVDLIKVP